MRILTRLGSSHLSREDAFPLTGDVEFREPFWSWSRGSVRGSHEIAEKHAPLLSRLFAPKGVSCPVGVAMTPLAILQLHILPRCLRLPALTLACSLVLMPAAQNQQSSTPPQSLSDSGMRSGNLRMTKLQRPLGTPPGL